MSEIEAVASHRGAGSIAPLLRPAASTEAFDFAGLESVEQIITSINMPAESAPNSVVIEGTMGTTFAAAPGTASQASDPGRAGPTLPTTFQIGSPTPGIPMSAQQTIEALRRLDLLQWQSGEQMDRLEAKHEMLVRTTNALAQEMRALFHMVAWSKTFGPPKRTSC